MRRLDQSTAANIMVFMADASDGKTGKTGLTLTVTLSKNGGAFASISPTVTERGNGWYNVALVAGNTDTLGDLIVRATGTGADPGERALYVSPLVNVMSATKGAIQVAYAKSLGTVNVVRGDIVSIPYGPLGKDVTNRRIYFGVKASINDVGYVIGLKEITSSVTAPLTFTGLIPLTSQETGLTPGLYYAEMESRDMDGVSNPLTEMQFTLRIVPQVIG